MTDPANVQDAVSKIGELDQLIPRISNMALEVRGILESEREQLMNYLATHAKGLGE